MEVLGIFTGLCCRAVPVLPSDTFQTACTVFRFQPGDLWFVSPKGIQISCFVLSETFVKGPLRDQSLGYLIRHQMEQNYFGCPQGML